MTNALIALILVQLFPKQKDAEFSEDGRPLHAFFYCEKPNYHQALFEVVEKIEDLSLKADRATARGWRPDEDKLINTPVYLSSTRWMNRQELGQLFEEARLIFFDIVSFLEAHCETCPRVFHFVLVVKVKLHFHLKRGG